MKTTIQKIKKDELEYESYIESRYEMIFIGKHMLVHKLEEDDDLREWYIEWYNEWIDEYYLCDEFSDFTKFKKLNKDFFNKFPELEIIFLIEVGDSISLYYNLLYYFVSTFYIEMNEIDGESNGVLFR